MIGRFIFDTPQDLHKSVTSPERERARADMANFPLIGGATHGADIPEQRRDEQVARSIWTTRTQSR